MSSEEAKWKEDSEDLERLLSSSNLDADDSTVDSQIEGATTFLGGSYVDVQQKKERVPFFQGCSKAVFFLALGFALAIYGTGLTVHNHFGKIDDLDRFTPSNIQQQEQNDQSSVDVDFDYKEKTRNNDDTNVDKNENPKDEEKKPASKFTDFEDQIEEKDKKEKKDTLITEEDNDSDYWSDSKKTSTSSESSTTKRIAILAERNSGLTWFTNQIQSCFPTLEVVPELTRPGHWFQSNETAVSEPTVVISLFLNVYHWVDAMRQHPHHSPNHKNQEWVSFVSSPWTIHRSKEDLEYRKSVDDPEELSCQMGFKYDEVISCIDQRDEKGKEAPVYELKHDGSGKSYSSILQLRHDKIKNWLSTEVWENVEFVHKVQYELLTQEGGFLSVIKVIEIKTQTKSSCNFEDLRKIVAPIFWGDVSTEYINWMKMNTMWDAEFQIGYDRAIPIISIPGAKKGEDSNEKEDKADSSSTSYPSNSIDGIHNSPATTPTP